MCPHASHKRAVKPDTLFQCFDSITCTHVPESLRVAGPFCRCSEAPCSLNFSRAWLYRTAGRSRDHQAYRRDALLTDTKQARTCSTISGRVRESLACSAGSCRELQGSVGGRRSFKFTCPIVPVYWRLCCGASCRDRDYIGCRCGSAGSYRHLQRAVSRRSNLPGDQTEQQLASS